MNIDEYLNNLQSSLENKFSEFENASSKKEENAGEYIFCPECGTKVDSNANFCPNCGYGFNANDD